MGGGRLKCKNPWGQGGGGWGTEIFWGYTLCTLPSQKLQVHLGNILKNLRNLQLCGLSEECI